jgi:predicted DNA-binding transcriptional regulator AlpA
MTFGDSRSKDASQEPALREQSRSGVTRPRATGTVTEVHATLADRDLKTVDDAPRRWLSRRQTMAHLGISENTLDRLIARKEIRSFLVGSKRIVPVREIEAYEARKLDEADPAY